MKFEKPSFVLTDRLPALEVAPMLLGRVVADIRHPTHDFKPKDPRPSLQDETIKIVDSNVSILLSVVRNKIVKMRIADISGLTLDDEVSSSKTFKSPRVKTETLQQHPEALEQVLEKHRKDIEKLLAHGECEDLEKQKSELGFEAKAPTDLAAQVASHGTANAPKSGNLEVEAHITRQGSARSSFQGAGEQVFAIQYRTIGLRRPLPLSKKEPEVAYGELKVVDFQDGVYSSTGRKMIFEDDQLDEGELDDESVDFMSSDVFREDVCGNEDMFLLDEC